MIPADSVETQNLASLPDQGNSNNDRYPARKGSLLQVIRAYIEANGRSPTLRELSALSSWSLPTLHSYIRRLKADGLITCQAFQFRAIRIK